MVWQWGHSTSGSLGAIARGVEGGSAQSGWLRACGWTEIGITIRLLPVRQLPSNYNADSNRILFTSHAIIFACNYNPSKKFATLDHTPCIRIHAFRKIDTIVIAHTNLSRSSHQYTKQIKHPQSEGLKDVNDGWDSMRWYPHTEENGTLILTAVCVTGIPNPVCDAQLPEGEASSSSSLSCSHGPESARSSLVDLCTGWSDYP